MALSELEKRHTDAAVRTLTPGDLSAHADAMFRGQATVNSNTPDININGTVEQVRLALALGQRMLMGYEDNVGIRLPYGLAETTDEKRKKEDKQNDWARLVARQQAIIQLNRDLERLAEMQSEMAKLDEEMKLLHTHLAQDDDGNIDWDFYAQSYLSEEQYLRTPPTDAAQKEAVKKVLLNKDGEALDKTNPLSQYLSKAMKKEVISDQHNQLEKETIDRLKQEGHDDLVDKFKTQAKLQKETGQFEPVEFEIENIELLAEDKELIENSKNNSPMLSEFKNAVAGANIKQPGETLENSGQLSLSIQSPKI